MRLYNLKHITRFNSGKSSLLAFNCFKQIKYASTSSFELNSIIDVKKSVKDQILSGKPVVALESTIITHGMPYPNNLETALEVEEIVKSQGSYPATIAIVNGQIKVGLEKEELEKLAKKDPAVNTIKCSTRDLPYAISKSLYGGTTVAATLFIANKVGIKVFATGGIGGVHRNSHETLDISTDLTQLGKTPMAVVCSGVKSILDIPKTLEFLETQGVFVSSYQSPECQFPAFYTRSSGCTVPYNLNNATEAANLIKSLLQLKLKSGILIAVPIPEENAVPDELINKAIDSALKEGKQRGIIGKEITPFVLDAVSKITKGVSLSSNMALIKNNAKVASQIANELYNITPFPKDSKTIWSDKKNLYCNGNQNDLKNIVTNFNVKNENEKHVISDSNIPVVIGASILDITMKVEEDFMLNGATYNTETNLSGGGVGRNIAEGIWKLYGSVNFISAVGNDDVGKNITNVIPSNCTRGVVNINGYTTSICNVIFDKLGECKLILGNMKIHKEITADLVNRYENFFKNAPLIVMDGNLLHESTKKILELSKKYNTPGM